MWLLGSWSQQDHGAAWEALDEAQQAVLKVRLKQTLRTNTFDASTGTLTVSPDRADAIAAVARHYDALFSDDPALAQLRDAYAMPPDTVGDPERRRALTAFFFWTSWAASTNRPGEAITYTSNWPPEGLIDNVPTGQMMIWSVISFVALLAGVGLLAWWFAREAHRDTGEPPHVVPERDPLLNVRPTPSMMATLKYFWVVVALAVVQMVMGILVAHYGVEGSGFYGFPLHEWLPYSVARSWHLQLGLFWIATAWLATGLYIAPSVSGYEPPYQKLGVDVLFACLVVIVVGTLAGQWLSIQQHLGLTASWWFGHQGYEYVDLGRFWQIFLFVGLFLWLGLVFRAIRPAFRKSGVAGKNLLGLFLLASGAIALFYGAGLMYGPRTNLAIAEYWRWWVVHLWVEGFFEVFATTVIAFLFTRMALVRTSTATAAVLFATVRPDGAVVVADEHAQREQRVEGLGGLGAGDRGQEARGDPGGIGLEPRQVRELADRRDVPVRVVGGVGGVEAVHALVAPERRQPTVDLVLLRVRARAREGGQLAEVRRRLALQPQRPGVADGHLVGERALAVDDALQVVRRSQARPPREGAVGERRALALAGLVHVAQVGPHVEVPEHVDGVALRHALIMPLPAPPDHTPGPESVSSPDTTHARKPR